MLKNSRNNKFGFVIRQEKFTSNIIMYVGMLKKTQGSRRHLIQSPQGFVAKKNPTTSKLIQLGFPAVAVSEHSCQWQVMQHRSRWFKDQNWALTTQLPLSSCNSELWWPQWRLKHVLRALKFHRGRKTLSSTLPPWTPWPRADRFITSTVMSFCFLTAECSGFYLRDLSFSC